MPTAFVTGGSGFVGGALIRRLAGDGWTVRALARSDRAEQAVLDAGAEPVRGDLDDTGAMAAAADGADVFHHAAAKVEDFGDPAEFERVTVQGTKNALAAAREAGVPRFVQVGTEAALMAGQPLVNVDETAPLRPDSPSPYPWSKAKAEQAVLDANGEGLETVVVRPRFVWGRGDTTLLPQIVAMTKAGKFAWIGGGNQLTATAHIDNTVEGLMLGAERGRPGGVYFVTDGEPVVFRDFVSDLIRTQDVEPPTRTLPLGVARAAATASEELWKLLRRQDRPPLTRFTVWVSALECTIDDTRAREELGYREVKTREDGLAELRADAGTT
ncbi:MAG TPA: NAD-dependent epimerase/dehydratase family protein [Thermoleophilaceae bacterium]|nr:NAD-dependent epimerase/dehydratase family protein [Thermoleophilaceae bacterium]